MALSDSDELHAKRLLDQLRASNSPYMSGQQQGIEPDIPEQGPFAEGLKSSPQPRPQAPVTGQTLTPGVSTSSKPFEPAEVKGTFGEACPQCGLLHPPLKDGEKCPNAPIKTKDESTGEEKIIDPTKFLVDMKNIIVSQMEIKKISNPENLFKFLTVEITKLLEGYKENA
jgi:hypothetical protein